MNLNQVCHIQFKNSFNLFLSKISDKGTDFLPQTQIFLFLYLDNLMVQTMEISNFDYLI